MAIYVTYGVYILLVLDISMILWALYFAAYPDAYRKSLSPKLIFHKLIERFIEFIGFLALFVMWWMNFSMYRYQSIDWLFQIIPTLLTLIFTVFLIHRWSRNLTLSMTICYISAAVVAGVLFNSISGHDINLPKIFLISPLIVLILLEVLKFISKPFRKILDIKYLSEIPFTQKFAAVNKFDLTFISILAVLTFIEWILQYDGLSLIYPIP